MGLHVEPPPLKLSVYTNEDSDGNALLKAHAYQAVTDGKVSAYSGTFTEQGLLTVFVGLTDNPAGVGDVIEKQQGSEIAFWQSVSALVAKGEYFEVTADASAGTVVIRWKSFGALRKPVDFN